MPPSLNNPMDEMTAAGYCSDSDRDDLFDEDMEALRRACLITGKGPPRVFGESDPADAGGESGSDEDDVDLLRNLQNRFSTPQADLESVPIVKPLCAILPSDDMDDEDDFATLRAIRRRFEQFQSENFLLGSQSGTTGSILLGEASTTNSRKKSEQDMVQGFHQSDDDFITDLAPLGGMSMGTESSSLTQWHCSDDGGNFKFSTTPSHFPRSCQTLLDAIKKNRSCQKFIRNKMIQIEARIEENKNLKDRIKCLMDFQVASKRRAGSILCQKKDPRVRLISPNSKKSYKADSKNRLFYGPAENSHVSKYKMVMTRFPVTISKLPWSKSDKEKLAKGIKQQYQEMVMLNAMELVSGENGSLEDSNVMAITSTTDYDVAFEDLRSFLPLVNWERLATMYFTGRTTGRTGAECEARWLNCEDPLINDQPWTTLEEKKLLFITQDNGVFNWIDIAVRLGTSRTPYQCLARYQRSLNAHILKKEWTPEDDTQLRAAVGTFGEDWQLVAFNMEGWAGHQCSNRWRKTLHPKIEKKGLWSIDEDKRLKVAVMLFGAKNWNKIANFVHGRNQSQCRERWVNCLDPSLCLEPWTEEEDSRLIAAITEFGHKWSKIATCVPPRTDNQCRRRWKVVSPHEVPLLQATKKMRKAALVSNFVDREKERPLIGPNDFYFANIDCSAVPEANKTIRKRKTTSIDLQQLRARKVKQRSSEKKSVEKKKRRKLMHEKEKHIQSAEGHSDILNLEHMDGELAVLKEVSHSEKRSVEKKKRRKSMHEKEKHIQSVEGHTDIIILEHRDGELAVLNEVSNLEKRSVEKKKRRKSMHEKEKHIQAAEGHADITNLENRDGELAVLKEVSHSEKRSMEKKKRRKSMHEKEKHIQSSEGHTDITNLENRDGVLTVLREVAHSSDIFHSVTGTNYSKEIERILGDDDDAFLDFTLQNHSVEGPFENTENVDRGIDNVIPTKNLQKKKRESAVKVGAKRKGKSVEFTRKNTSLKNAKKRIILKRCCQRDPMKSVSGHEFCPNHGDCVMSEAVRDHSLHRAGESSEGPRTLLSRA